MALNWSSNVSFSGLRKKTAKVNTSYPEKTYINLAVEDRRTIDARKAAVLAVVLVVLLALFLKFGIFDFMNIVSDRRSELAQQQTQLTQLQQQLESYDEVKVEYDQYEAASLVASKSTVSATQALRLIDEHVAPFASVPSFSFADDVLAVNLDDVTLDRIGAIVSELNAQPNVADVSVSTAQSQDGSSSAAVMTIMLTQE